MNDKQKTILFLIASALGIVLVVFFIVSINQKINTAPTANSVAFTGEGKVFAKPDIAKFGFTIVTQSTTSKVAQDLNSTKSKEVTDFLKTNGIEDKDIKVTNYNMYPQQSYPPYGGTPKITGYQVMQTYKVTIRDLEKANVVVDGVVSAGVNQVDQLQFDVENPEALKAEARQKAVDDAKKKAKDLESQIGIRLGRVVNFQENVGGYVYPYERMVSYAEGGGGGYGGAPSLPTGENEITVSVTMTYQIK